MNNKATSRKALTVFGLSWLIVLAVLTSSFFFEFEYDIIFQISVGLLLVLITIIFSCGGYYYLEIKVENNSTLIIKHYNLFPLWRKFKVFQIPVKRFEKYKIRKYFLGIFSFIYLYEESRKGVARYPGIGASAIPNSQQKRLIALLNNLIKIK
jgi:hypothetical protein